MKNTPIYISAVALAGLFAGGNIIIWFTVLLFWQPLPTEGIDDQLDYVRINRYILYTSKNNPVKKGILRINELTGFPLPAVLLGKKICKSPVRT